MKTIALLPLFIILMAAFAGCSDDNDNRPNGSSSGSITGNVKLTDEFGTDIINYSGMKVVTQTGAFGITDASGSFTISNLSSGTYNLSYEKSGYGIFRRFNIGVAGGSSVTTLNGTDILAQKSTSVISNLTVSWEPNDQTYTFGCDIYPAPDPVYARYFRIFFNKTSDVNHYLYLYTPANFWTATSATGVITGFSPQTLLSNGFQSGDSVYAVAIGESAFSNSFTYPGASIRTFPNLYLAGPSNTVGFQLP